MAVDDHGIETIRKAGEEVTPGDKSDYYIKVNDSINKAVLDAILAALGGTSGVDVFDEFDGTSSIGTTTVISNTVPAGKTWELSRVNVSCRQRIVYEIKIGATVVGSGRTGPGGPDSAFIFSPTRSASAGSSVTIDVIQSTGPVSDLEVYFMATEI